MKIVTVTVCIPHMSPDWLKCWPHDFEEAVDSISEREVKCKKCGVPGDYDDVQYSVYIPAT